MIRKSMPSGLTRGWVPVFPRNKREAFARRSCSNRKIERDDDSKKSHPALRAGLIEPAVFGGRDAGGRLEGAIERAERLKARIHRNGNHGHLGLRGVGQSGLRLLDPVIVEEDIEIAVPKPLVDQAP